MQRINLSPVARLFLVLIASAGSGAVGAPNLLAQESEGPCPAERVRGDLGLTGLECSSCTYYQESGTWAFRAEPVITGVEPGGPAAGLLKTGDVIAAINGELITSRKGGRLFSRIVGGEAVALTVRRNGRVRQIELVPTTRCEPAAAADHESLGVLADSLSNLSLPKGFIGSLNPDGWLGFGVSCSCSVQELGNGEVLWSFDEPPIIYSVDPAGPASRVGLRRGDVLLEIDGVPLVSDEGGKRFGKIEPGQAVQLEYERNGRRGSTMIKAVLRPDRDRASGRTYERILDLLADARSRAAEEAALQASLDELMELLRAAYAPALPDRRGVDPEALPLRFAGTLANADIEVRANGSTVVTVVEPGRELEIRVGDTYVRVKVR